MKRRILAIALTLCMLFSLLPMSALAATSYELYINNFQFSSTNLTYTSGSGSATYNPGTKTLTIKNLSLSTGGANTIIQSGISGLTMKIDGTLTLNLLASKVENGTDLAKVRTNYGIAVTADTTICGANNSADKDSIIIKSQSVGVDDTEYSDGTTRVGIRPISGAKLTMKNLTVSMTDNSTGSYAGHASMIRAVDTLNISGCKLVTDKCQFGVYVDAYSPVTITDTVLDMNLNGEKSSGVNFAPNAVNVMQNCSGYISGQYPVYTAGQLTISGGSKLTLIAGEFGIGAGQNHSQTPGKLILDNVNLEIQSEELAISAELGGSITLKSGTVNVTKATYGVQVKENSSFALQGGTLTIRGADTTSCVGILNKGTVNITGGSLKVDNVYTAIQHDSSTALSFTGGEHTLTAATCGYIGDTSSELKISNTAKVALNAGTGIQLPASSNSKLTVSGGELNINATAAGIELADSTSTMTLSGGKVNVTDKNASPTIIGMTCVGKALFSGAEVTFSNCKIDLQSRNRNNKMTGGKLHLSGYGSGAQFYFGFEMTGGEIDGSAYAYGIVAAQGTTTLKGGTVNITAAYPFCLTYGGIVDFAGANVTGNATAKCGLYVTDATEDSYKISGGTVVLTSTQAGANEMYTSIPSNYGVWAGENEASATLVETPTQPILATSKYVRFAEKKAVTLTLVNVKEGTSASYFPGESFTYTAKDAPSGKHFSHWELTVGGTTTNVGTGTTYSGKMPTGNATLTAVYENCSGGSADCQHLAVCSVCGKEYGILAAHRFTEEVEDEKYVITPPTCEGEGTYYKSCSVCGASAKNWVNATFTVPALGHAWGEWTSNGNGTHSRICGNNAEHTDTDDCSGGAATCQKKAVCDICHAEYGELAAHSYTAEVAEDQYLNSAATCTEAAVYYKSCTVCGASSEGTAFEATFSHGEAKGHAWGEWTSNGGGTHSRICGNDAEHKETEDCSGGTADCTHGPICDFCKAEYGKPGDHSYTAEVAEDQYLKSAATCTEAAVYYKSCTGCGESSKGTAFEATFSHGEAKGHAWGEWTSNGGGTHSRICGNDAEHKETEDCSGGTADCTHGPICDFCKAEYGKPGDHSYTAEVAEDQYLKSAATCTEAAVYYKSCTGCGESSKGTAFEATFSHGEAKGHAWGEWTSNGGGTHSRICGNDAEHKETEDCSGGTATCQQKAVCDLCHAEYGELAAHSYTAEVAEAQYLKTAATATEAAVYYKSCCFCGASSEGTEFEDTFTYGYPLGYDVDYLYCDANGANWQTGKRPAGTYIPVTDGDIEWTTGWYVVTGKLTIDGRVTVSGDVHLILTDGSELTVNGGIQVQDNSTESIPNTNALTIYAQSTEDNMGKLIAENIADNQAGIGGNERKGGGTITINGGAVEVTCGKFGAAIGGGFVGNGGTITINGGTVTATGDDYGTGIGGGHFCSSGTITINGGTVTATANGGAGIGGGEYGHDGGGSGPVRGTITINGGIINATAKSGAAIGGGFNDGNEYIITINDGTVDAKSGFGRGIGGGHMVGGDGGDITVTITGGTVTATYTDILYRNYGGGIGGACNGSAGNGGDGYITITGGTVTAVSNEYNAIGGGEAYQGNGGDAYVTITGGTVTAISETTTGIGGGTTRYDGTDGSCTFRTDNGNAVIFASSIADQSGKTSGEWSGIIFEGDSGAIYGSSATPIEEFTIKEGVTLTIGATQSLTIPEGMTVTNEGTIDNGGKIYVDGTLNGTVSGSGTVYYHLTVVGGTAAPTNSYNSKTYAKAGSEITLTPTVPAGYEMIQWNVSGADVTVSGNKFTMPGKAITVTAQFDLSTYSIDYELYGGTIHSGNVTSYTYGQGATLPTDVTKAGCTFAGWYDNANYTGKPVTAISNTEKENKKYWARWIVHVSTEGELNEALAAGETLIKLVADFTLANTLDLSDKIVTLDLNGHTLTGNIKLEDTSAAPKSILTLIDSNPAGGGVVKGNIMLTRDSGSVSHLYANGGTVTGMVSLSSYAGGIFCTSDTPTSFKGYAGNFGEIHGGIFYGNIKESCIKEKTVTFMDGDSRYALEVVAVGKKVAEPIQPAKVGYTFEGWYIGDTEYDFTQPITESGIGQTGKLVLYAKWSIDPNHTHAYGSCRVGENGLHERVCEICGKVEPATYTTAVTEPTCTSSGYTTHTCDVCGSSFVDTFVEGGHIWNAVLTEPTHTEMGFTTYTCSRCKESYTSNYVAPIGHSFDDGVVTKEATCTEEGEMLYTCSCGETFTAPIAKADHELVATVTEPTCTELGFTTHACKNCDYAYTDTYVSPTGHSFDNGTVTKEPSCTAEGETLYSCSCGETYTASIAKVDHVLVATVTESTCTEMGFTTHACKNCDYAYTDTYVAPTGHSFDNGTVTKEPSCTAEGETLYSCSCGETYTASIAKVDHVLVATVTESTCTEMGFTTHACKNCDYAYTDTYVAPTGHSFDNGTVTKEPSCTAEGETLYSCSCGETYTASIAKVDHVLVATVTESTCTEMGFTTHACKNCDYAYTDTYVAPTGHSFDNGTVTKEPSCTAEGETLYSCSCGETYTASIAKVDHVLVATVTESTCTEMGFTTHACKNCDYKYIDTYTAPVGHDWDEGKVASAPTLTETGILVQTCGNCGETKETTIPMLTACDGGNGCPSKAYVDVPDESHWAHVGIDFVLKTGLFYGTSETTFAPDATMTRAMLVTVLYRLEGKPETTAENPFEDIADGEWYTDAVVWAAANGIVTGVKDGIFNPDGEITREQMAAILFRYTKFKGLPLNDGDYVEEYPDIDKVSPYAAEAMRWANAEGLINGMGSGETVTLAPDGNATRAQVAAIFMRYVQNVLTK